MVLLFIDEEVMNLNIIEVNNLSKDYKYKGENEKLEVVEIG